MSCQHCNHLAVTHQIKTEKGFTWIIEKAHTSIENGTLQELSINHPYTVKMVIEDNCPSDFLDLRFRCNHCQEYFILSCENWETKDVIGVWKIEEGNEK